MRKADPIKNQDFQDNKKGQDSRKQRKGSQRSSKPKLDWQRVVVTQEGYEQEDILKKIKALAKRKSIADKKAELPPHMNHQVNVLLDEKNNFECDKAFIWTLTQLDRRTWTNKNTNRRETETLTLFLKRAPRADVNVTVVYNNIERAKLQQNRPQPQPQPKPQPQPQQQFPPQPRAQSQGPPGTPKGPGKVGPPPVQIVHGGPKNGGKFGGKGGPDDVIHVIETGGPQRKAGKTVYKGGKSVNCRSDDDRSSRSSQSSSSSCSDSDNGSGYSDSETDPSTSSVGSKFRPRRDSGYGRGSGKGLKPHENGFFMVNRPRRHSASYVPDAPRIRAPSYERLSTNPIEVEHKISEAKAEGFAAGFTTASRVAAADRTTMPSQRTIMYPDNRSQRSSLRSLDEDVRAVDETRAEALRLENLRLQEDRQLRHQRRFREDLRLQEEANARLREEARREEGRRFSELPTLGELRLRTDFRPAQDTFLQDELPPPRMRDLDYLRRGSLSPLSFESMPSPRAREFDYLRRGSLSPLPLDNDIPFQHVRNPFTPRPWYRN